MLAVFGHDHQLVSRNDKSTRQKSPPPQFAAVSRVFDKKPIKQIFKIRIFLFLFFMLSFNLF